jgi:hypothetical protein
MTFERKIVVGLDDIKAISFECNKCHSRITILADKLRDVPENCHNCGEIWKSRGLSPHHQDVASPYSNFVSAIWKIRTLLENGAPFKILLEFDEPKIIG